MMVQLLSTAVAGLAACSVLVTAHPGHDFNAEAAERAAFMKRTPVTKRSLTHCAENLAARGHTARSIQRREKAVHSLRRRMGLPTSAPLLKARSFEEALNTSHHSNLQGEVTQYYNPQYLFSSNATCALADDATEGPYYVSGEYVRTNIAEDQGGVPLWIDIQIINANTCEPEQNIFTDAWHCNATGVYSGVQANGNGDGSNANLDTTFCRGLQKSDEDGAIQFQTIFPGHYTGRATHIHILTHNAADTVKLANGTVSGLYTTHSSHVGQIFFDQDLITEVELVSPYKENTQQLTLNENDGILKEEAADIDPFMEYVLLGDSVSDGIFAWISMAIDPTTDRELSPAAYWTKEGGIVNPKSGPGGPGGPPSGSAPSGPAPNSSAVPSGL